MSESAVEPDQAGPRTPAPAAPPTRELDCTAPLRPRPDPDTERRSAREGESVVPAVADRFDC
jgi:hypothetical protein